MNIITTLFASLSLSFLLLLSLPPLSLSAKCNIQDKKVLKQIEKELTIPPHFQSWTTDTDCCDWDGVWCYPNTDRVTYLTITEGSVVSGRIPDAVGDLSALTYLAFITCPNLTGPLPQSLKKLTNLTTIALDSTSVSGPVPSFLSQLKNLDTIAMRLNKFSGSIPASLSELPKLNFLRLDGNKLTGSIPESLWKLGQIDSAYIAIRDNQLTGKVPSSFGNASFRWLDFANNKLEGDISFLFGKNKNTLKLADFSGNLFEFDMSKVEFPSTLDLLYLNHNKIYGNIPVAMTELAITDFNVSYNRLCGKIPTGGKLQDYDQTAYFHNRCLCGAPLPACK